MAGKWPVGSVGCCSIDIGCFKGLLSSSAVASAGCFLLKAFHFYPFIGIAESLIFKIPVLRFSLFSLFFIHRFVKIIFNWFICSIYFGLNNFIKLMSSINKQLFN